MDLTVLNLAVPHLSEDLKPTSSQLLWIMDIYGFFIAGSLITMGTLGDRIGRRKVLLYGAVAFGLASALAAFSRSAELLIVSRALLGVAGATLAPSTLSLIRNMFLDDHERTVAIGIWVTCFSVGAAIGPVLGGLLLERFWWGSVFLLNVPIMILLVILAPILLPEFRDEKAGGLDLFSAALSLVAVLLMIYGLKAVAIHGIAVVSVSTIFFGVVLGFWFVVRQKALPYPLIDVNLFRSPSFTASLSLNMFCCFIAFGAFFFTGQYMQLVMNFSPLKAGLWSTPTSLAFILGSLLAPQLVRKYQPGHVLAVGLFIAALGFFILARLEPTSGLLPVVGGMTIYSLGISPIFTLSTDLVVGSVPPERAGSAASISETSTEFGGALGMAVLGSVGTALYRSRITAGMPFDISPEVVEVAHNTLGGAVSVANELPEGIANNLLLLAKSAFTDALQFISAINILILIILMGVALRYIRRKHKAG